MPRAVVISSSADARLARASTWLAERGAVTILAASIDAAAEVARRAVTNATLGWQRATVGSIAASLARAELARLGLAPASTLALEAICARIVDDHPEALGRLLPIRERPGLPSALARTLGELRLARLTPADPELARLLAAYELELERARLVDRAGLLGLATEVAKAASSAVASRESTSAPSLLLIDVPLRSRAEVELVAALAAVAKDVLAVLPAGDGRSLEFTKLALEGAVVEEITDAASPLAHLHAGLFSDVAGPPVPEEAVTVLSAPGESRECVEIARLALAEAERGTPFDRMAVFLRAPQYGAHVAEAFRRARIPVFFARGTKRPDPSGRAFLALLACAAEGLSARRFAEYLSLGEVPDETKEGAPPPPVPRADRVAAPDDETLHALLAAIETTPEIEAPKTGPAEEDRAIVSGTLRAPRHWERLLVEAAVIGEASRWRLRLDGHAAKLALDIETYAKKDEAALMESSRRELAALEALRRYALPLIDDLAALPKEATWGEWVDKLGAVATRALRNSDRVLGVLGELEPMAKVGGVTISEVRLVLEPRLTQLRVPELGRRYGKVFVATTEEARGLAFDVVFVPGLAEKIFPAKVVEDPLLLDERRRKLSPDLATNKDRTDDERLALRLAVGAASRRVVLSYPRLDVEQARPRTPSFYGLEVLRVVEGQLRDFEYLAKRAARTAEARIGWPAPPKRDDAIDEAEYDLALLKDVLEKPESEVGGEARYLLDANEHLKRALRFRWMRWDPTALRSSDGFVAAAEEALVALREHGTDKRSFSPTALQNFAACPYRFLLSAVHRLAPREDLDAIEDMDPLQRGSLVHEVIYTLLSELRDEGGLPITAANLDAARDRLDVVLRDVAAEFEARLHPAIQRVWNDAIAGIAADLREWLRRTSEEETWTPAFFELSFGLKDARAQDARSKDDAVTLDGGLRLRGSIDLVERSKSGALRATDFKTGKMRAKKEETVIGGGEILQPVLYALTLERLFPDTKIDEGVLYYCTAAGNFEQVRVPLNEEARAAARLVAKTVGDAITNGFLPAAPMIEKKGYSACTWCDFKPVCGPYEEIRTRKKPQGPLKVLNVLRKTR